MKCIILILISFFCFNAIAIEKCSTQDCNWSPVADFKYEVKNKKVTLDASDSYDEDGTIFEYNWDFGDGTTGMGKKIEHEYSSIDTYNVKLTIVDNAGLDGSLEAKVKIGLTDFLIGNLLSDSMALVDINTGEEFAINFSSSIIFTLGPDEHRTIYIKALNNPFYSKSFLYNLTQPPRFSYAIINGQYDHPPYTTIPILIECPEVVTSFDFCHEVTPVGGVPVNNIFLPNF